MVKRVLIVAVAAVLAVSVIGWFRYFFYLRPYLKGQKTMFCMNLVMRILEAEKPDQRQLANLGALLGKYDRLECAKDAWGHALVVQRDSSGAYRITSLGRDGRSGPCCRKWVADWDDDAVYSEQGWLQVWNPSAAIRQPHGGS